MKHFLVCIMLLAFLLRPTWVTSPTRRAFNGLFPDVRIKVNGEIMDLASSLMETGKFEYKGVKFDFGKVQTIEIKDGEMIFNPPVELRYKFARTTLSTAHVTTSGELIEVDFTWSPVDVDFVRNDDE